MVSSILRISYCRSWDIFMYYHLTHVASFCPPTLPEPPMRILPT